MSLPRSLAFSAVPRLLLCSVCAAIAGCTVGPDYRRPEVVTPAGFKGAVAPTAGAEAPSLASNWWTLFQDETLTQLSQDVVHANLDIKAAMARVDEARAATQSARGSFFPSLSFAPSVRRALSPPTGTRAAATTTTYTLPVDLDYEVDLWGRLRRQLEYYRGLERASAADFAVVQQTALADLAQGYFTVRLLDKQTAILSRTLVLYRQQKQLTESKARTGLVPPTDVLQAQNQIDQAETQQIELERARERELHALAVLVGRAPSDFAVTDAAPAAHVPEIPAGLPAALLSRRPDVAEAEQKLIATNAQIGGATANFYPTLSLTGSAGFESLDVNRLANWESRVWSVAPGLTLPIFQGGKLTAALAQAKAGYEEQLATYRQTVLGAYRDVEDELSDLRFLARETDSLNETLRSAQENVRLVQLQYVKGLSSALQFITANQTLLSTELALASAENQRLIATVLLIKAVGGGWDPSLPLASTD